jgi:hypothetical protein
MIRLQKGRVWLEGRTSLDHLLHVQGEMKTAERNCRNGDQLFRDAVTSAYVHRAQH